MPYSPPASATTFQLSIPDADLKSLLQLISLSPIGPKTYENTQSAQTLGVTHDWLTTAKEHWLSEERFSWRAEEARINSFPNYKIRIDEIDLHFVALFSDREDAVPIVFLHGWPGSFLEFLPLCELVRKKWPDGKDMPYHVVVPSLPGYTLSGSGPLEKNWRMEDSARVVNGLMVELGFKKYIAQGGDVGSFVTTILAKQYDECVAFHLNMLATGEAPDVSTLSSSVDKRNAESAGRWQTTGSAYAREHATKPATIGHVLTASPLAQLAWIGEKFLLWPSKPPPLSFILTNVTLYALTSSFSRSIYPYRQLFGSKTRPDLSKVNKPLGFSRFPDEIHWSGKEAVAEMGDLKMFNEHDDGGHFAALEKPEELWKDVEEFVGIVWQK